MNKKNINKTNDRNNKVDCKKNIDEYGYSNINNKTNIRNKSIEEFIYINDIIEKD